MYIVAGLGNPTREYIGTRHNVGFCVIDCLAERNWLSTDAKGHKALYTKGVISGQKVVLAKPQTYMNLSGASIRELADYYKVPSENIMIIYDDIALDVGQLRVRSKGSAGGHNGIKSIISHLGTMEFPRIRVGVGEKPRQMDLADHVLGRFSKDEAADVEESILNGAKAVEVMLQSGIDQAMNQFNGKQR